MVYGLLQIRGVRVAGRLRLSAGVLVIYECGTPGSAFLLGGWVLRVLAGDLELLTGWWAYAHGVRSSREIERLCGTDVAFRVICAGNIPDHVDVRPVPG